MTSPRGAQRASCQDVLALAVITKHHSPGFLNDRCVFLTVLDATGPRSRCWQTWFLVGTRFLACRRLPSHWPHIVEEERDLVPLPLTRTLLSSWGPTLMTSQRPYLQVPLYWGTGLRHRNLVGGTHSAYNSLVCDRIDCSRALPCACLPTSAMPSSHFPSFLCVGGDHMTSFWPIRRKKTPRGFWE